MIASIARGSTSRQRPTTTQVRPEDPILWMADYLRDNNPNTNADAAARAAKRRRLDEEARAAEAAKPAA